MALVELPPNTDKSKAERDKRIKEREDIARRSISDNEVSVHKEKGMLETFLSKIVVNDLPDTKKFLVEEVIEPRIRSGILDVIVEGSRFLLGGEYKGISSSERRNSLRDGGRYARGSGNSSSRSNSSDSGRNSSSSGSFDSRDYPFPSRGKAEETIAKLKEDIQDYDRATVAAFLKKAGVTPKWSDMDIGWFNLDDGTWIIRPTIDGYILVLPKPVSVKN